MATQVQIVSSVEELLAQPSQSPMPVSSERRSMIDFIPARCVVFVGIHEDPTSYHAPSLEGLDSEEIISARYHLLQSLDNFQEYFSDEDGGWGTIIHRTTTADEAGEIASRIGTRRLSDLNENAGKSVAFEGGTVAIDFDLTIENFLESLPDESAEGSTADPELMATFSDWYLLQADGSLSCVAEAG